MSIRLTVVCFCFILDAMEASVLSVMLTSSKNFRDRKRGVSTDLGLLNHRVTTGPVGCNPENTSEAW
jgi:hypothetical protein